MSDLPTSDETEREDASQVTAEGDAGGSAPASGETPGPIEEPLIAPDDR